MRRVLVMVALAGACGGTAARPPLLEARVQPATETAAPRSGMYVRPPAALIELPVVALVAERLADDGRWAEAARLFEELAAGATPAEACPLRVRAVEVRIMKAPRADILDAAERLVGVPPAGDCAVSADACLGEIAQAWHRELDKTRADPRVVMRAWRLALAVATTRPRAAVMAQNLAELRWAEAVRLADLTDWIEAGLAFREAAARAGDPAFDTAAVDAWANGARVAARATPAQRARLRGVLDEVTGPEGPRARTLAASLR